VSFLGCDALPEAVEWNLSFGVSDGRTPWPAGHVARLTGQHLVNYRLNQVSNRSWDSYKYPPAIEGNQIEAWANQFLQQNQGDPAWDMM
jgi:hypothetical protein